MLRAARRPAATASIAVHGALAAASPPANTPARLVTCVCLSVTIWPRSTSMPVAPCRKSSTMLWPMAKMTVSQSRSCSVPSSRTGGRQPRASGSPSAHELKVDAAGAAVRVELDAVGHARAVEEDALGEPLVDLLVRGGHGGVVLDAVDDDLLGAQAQGGAAGVEGDVAAADDDDLLAHLDRLADGGLVQQAGRVEHVRRVGAGDRQRAAALQADGQVDGPVAVVQQAVDVTSMPQRLPQTRSTPRAEMRSTSCCSAALGRRYSGMPKRSMPPGSALLSKTVVW